VEASIEEPIPKLVKRHVVKPSFIPRVACAITMIFTIVRACVRLETYIGSGAEYHAAWWCLLALLGFVIPGLEWFWCQDASKTLAKWGKGSRSQVDGLAEPLIDSAGNSNFETSFVSDVEVPPIAPHYNVHHETSYKAGWKDLLGVCAADWHLILLASIALLLAATGQIFIPRFTGQILDVLVEGMNTPHKSIVEIPGFQRYMISLIFAAMLVGVFSGVRGSIFTIIGARVSARLRYMLMDSLFAQDIGFFDVVKSGDLTSRLCTDTTSVGDQVSLNVNVFLRALVQAIGVLFFMFYIQWQLTIVAFISVPFQTIISKWYGHILRKISKVTQKKLADSNVVSEAAISSMSTVKAFGASKTELEEYNKAMDEYLRMNRKSASFYFLWMSTITIMPQLVIAMVLFYGAMFVQSKENDHMSTGQLISFLLYLSSLGDAFDSMGSVFSGLFQAIGAADKIFELIHRRPRTHGWGELGPVDDKPVASSTYRDGGLIPDTCEGNVKLENVEMYYPARPNRRILDGITLTAPTGKVIALVGPSGGGKSSIISLIQNLYTVSGGRVTIDNNDVHSINADWLHRNVSVVSQEPTLYARSVRRNIIFGLEGKPNEPTLDEIKHAAYLANASSFIENLPEGYDTNVGERGTQLSGGQKQRIAIARALVRKPTVLLLDEATSALDAESEAAVQDAIDGMLQSETTKNMTLIIVAHRLSTVINADTIYVIKDGKVVESGNHEELIKNQEGSYFNLVSRQISSRSMTSLSLLGGIISKTDGSTDSLDAELDRELEEDMGMEASLSTLGGII